MGITILNLSKYFVIVSAIQCDCVSITKIEIDLRGESE